MEPNNQFKCGSECSKTITAITINVHGKRPHDFPQAILEKSDEIMEHYNIVFPNESLVYQDKSITPFRGDSILPSKDTNTSPSRGNVSGSNMNSVSTSTDFIGSSTDSLIWDARSSWRSSENQWLENAHMKKKGGPPSCPAGVCGHTFTQQDCMTSISQCKNRRPIYEIDLPPQPKSQGCKSRTNTVTSVRPSTAPPLSLMPGIRGVSSTRRYVSYSNSTSDSRYHFEKNHPTSAWSRKSIQLQGIMRPFNAYVPLPQPSNRPSSSRALALTPVSSRNLRNERPCSALTALSKKSNRPISGNRVLPSIPVHSLNFRGILRHDEISNSGASAQSTHRGKPEKSEFHLKVPPFVEMADNFTRKRGFESQTSQFGVVPASHHTASFPPHFFPRSQRSGLHGSFPGDKPPPLPYKPPHQAQGSTTRGYPRS